MPNARARAPPHAGSAQVEVLTSTLAQMQTTNTAYAGSLRGADSEDAVQEQRALR
jgi:hypothetical protein